MILPFTILRRLDCILEPTKDEVLAEYQKLQGLKVDQGVVLKSTFKHRPGSGPGPIPAVRTAERRFGITRCQPWEVTVPG